MTLVNPTPLQWKALSSAAVLPLREVIDAAPVVAVMDEVSGAMEREIRLPGGHVVLGRYATLAAVMGVRQQQNAELGSFVTEKGEGDVRLFGIGRCVITAFKNRIVEYDIEAAALAPLTENDGVQQIGSKDTEVEIFTGNDDDCNDNDGCEIDWDNMPGFGDEGLAVCGDETKVSENVEEITVDRGMESDDDCNDNDGCDIDWDNMPGFGDEGLAVCGDETKVEEIQIEIERGMESVEEDEIAEIKSGTPIIIGEFSMLNDFETSSSLDDYGRKRLCSPTHAINALNTASLKVERAHQQRQHIVAGLKAAKARLDATKKMMQDFESDEDLFKSIFEEECLTEDDSCMTVDDFLATFKGNFAGSGNFEQRTTWEKLKGIENYGLHISSSLSSISELTDEAIAQLEPYYSEIYREREAYRHEILSFVAWKALEGVVDHSQMAWALRSGSTVERLERAHEAMMEHRSLLEQIAKEVVAELRECGEECTDLW